MFKAIYSDGITLHLINEFNIDEVRALFAGFEDSKEMLEEINESYLPEYEICGAEVLRREANHICFFWDSKSQG